MISRFFIDRPIFATVVSLIIVLAGFVSMNNLPVEQYPNLTPPTVMVRALYPGASAETQAETVVAPIEDKINGVDGMIYMNRVQNYPLQSYLQTIVINPDAFFRNATNISENLSRYLNLVNARTTNAAQLFLATIPIMLVYPFLQRFFTSGLVMGSVKG